MPFYEYVCDSCGHQFEKMQSINAKPLTTCPECGKSIRRIIFPSAIVYKGSGFYSTEYGKSRFNHPSDKSGDNSSKTAKSTDKAGSSDKQPSGTDASTGTTETVKKPHATKTGKGSGSSGSTSTASSATAV